MAPPKGSRHVPRRKRRQISEPGGTGLQRLLELRKGEVQPGQTVAKLPGNKWALHDFCTQFKANTPENPLGDGGGSAVKTTARSGENEYGNPVTDLVVRCSNVQRNILFNEAQCQVSYHKDACQSEPLPDPENYNRVVMYDPSNDLVNVERVSKYLPLYAVELCSFRLAFKEQDGMA